MSASPSTQAARLGRASRRTTGPLPGRRPWAAGGGCSSLIRRLRRKHGIDVRAAVAPAPRQPALDRRAAARYAPAMAFHLTGLDGAPFAAFDTVIDVRAPSEFAEDHVPGAVNLPVLSDAERARIGTIYKQHSPFEARKLGAALVARNAATHIEGALIDRPGGWRPLVYCWRGGQRSGAFATILGQIGWRVEVLEGGYRSYRRAVAAMLHDRPLTHRLIRLDGNTGTAKTRLLALLARAGAQVVDLEGLAGHRGSALGAVAGGQPAQKGFESRLAAAFLALDPNRPVLVEAESSRIGTLRLPPALWRAMSGAPRIVIEAPVPARAAYLTRAYADLTAETGQLRQMLDRLRPHCGHEAVAQWQGLADRGAFAELAQALITHHYDPAYGRARARDDAPVTAVLDTPDLSEPALQTLADRIAGVLRGV